MSIRPQWSIVAGIVVLVAAVLIGVVTANTAPGTGSVRAVISAGTGHRVVDVAVVDATGHEYVGDDRAAGQSETLQAIPAGDVQVNVGSCRRSATVRVAQTVVVAFDPAVCIH